MTYVYAFSAIVCFLISGSFCAELYFLVSKPVKLPDPATVSLSKPDIVQANKYMLGLTAEAPVTWTSDGDIFRRPRALAIVTVIDGKALNNLPSSGYAVSKEGDDFNHEELVNSKIFGDEEQEWIVMRNAQLEGSQIVFNALNVSPKIEIKTKSEPLRQEIENLHKITESISKSTIIRNKNTPTIFIIDVNGLPTAERELTVDDYKLAVSELENAIGRLISMLRNIYSDRFIAEIITESMSEIKSRQKRQSSGSDDDRISKLRNDLNVHEFSSGDYPAVFGIIVLVIVLFSLTVLFVAAGMWNMDPGRDSIIYRVATTRMKKE